MSDVIKQYPAKPSRVYFYATCLVDLFYPEVGLAGIQLLEREGIEVIFPQHQSCCGQPAYTSGLNGQARTVAASQLELFPENWPVVVPSGSCAGMLRKHYPRLFAGTGLAEQAEQLAGRTWELTDFLLHVCRIRLQDHGEPVKVAVHTSCSGRREMGIADTGPALLAQLDNVELVQQARPAECCGFGGTFAVRHPEISAAMVEDKARALDDCGADQFVSTDCGCLMNIDGFADKQKLATRGQHVVSFLWQRSKGGTA